MKTTTLALATLTALAALATPAVAGPDFHVSLRFGAPAPVAVCPPPAPVVRYAPPPPAAYYPAPARVGVYDRHHREAGFWKEVVVKTWVPARVVNSHDRYGRHVRVVEPGHFIYTTDRVWVSHCG